MGETQVLAPAGIEPKPITANGGASAQTLARLQGNPIFQRFCEDRRKPVLTNDSLQHARDAVNKAYGNEVQMLEEFVAWRIDKGYPDE